MSQGLVDIILYCVRCERELYIHSNIISRILQTFAFKSILVPTSLFEGWAYLPTEIAELIECFDSFVVWCGSYNRGILYSRCNNNG